MMGENHARFAAVFALGAAVAGAQVSGLVFAPDIMLAVTQASGYGLLPDIDHRSSIATRSFPPLTVPLHWLTVWIHRVVYSLTRREDDPPSRTGRAKPRFRGRRWWTRRLLPSLFGAARSWRSAHRGITHSIVTCTVLSALAVLMMVLAGSWWAIGVICAGLALSSRYVFAIPVTILYAGLVVWHFGAWGAFEHLERMAPLWGIAMFLGLVSHVCGDGCTKSGSPLWAPLSWQTYRFPLNFETNKWFEKNVVKWVLIGMIVYLSGLLVDAYFHGAIVALLSALAHLFGIGR